MAATLGDEDEVHSAQSTAFAETLEPEVTDDAPETLEQPGYEPRADQVEHAVANEVPSSAIVDIDAGERPISSNSLGGSFTDNVGAAGVGTSTPRESTTGGHRPAVKQLAANTVLNGRYEIVRRIGGGGMGAVYLAKDRNLGDAPRAVKEMVESHLDPAQHEKTIGDYAEDLAAQMLATILGVDFDINQSYNERLDQWKLSGQIVKTRNITQTAIGKRKIWTTVVAAAVLIMIAAWPLYLFSRQELAPVEDQSHISLFFEASPDSTVAATNRQHLQIVEAVTSFPETQSTWSLTTAWGGFGGLVAKDWHERTRSTEQMYGQVFGAVSQVPGLRVFPRLDPPLPRPAMKTNALDLRKGNLVSYEGRTCEVIHWNILKNDRRQFVQMKIKDLQTGRITFMQAVDYLRDQAMVERVNAVSGETDGDLVYVTGDLTPGAQVQINVPPTEPEYGSPFGGEGTDRSLTCNADRSAARDRGARCGRSRSVHRQGGDDGHHGAVGLGQEHLAQHPGLPRPADQRALPARRRGRLGPVRRAPVGDPHGPHRLRVPDLQPRAPADAAREHRAAAVLPRLDLRRSPPALPPAGRAGRAGRAPAPSAHAALGRPAAARRDRAQPGQRPDRAPGRRADRKPRFGDLGRDPGAARRAEQRGERAAVGVRAPDAVRPTGASTPPTSRATAARRGWRSNPDRHARTEGRRPRAIASTWPKA